MMALKMGFTRAILIAMMLYLTFSTTALASHPACPSTVSSDSSVLLAAAEACLEARGRFNERDATQALTYAQQAVTARPASPVDLARAYDLQAQAHFWLGQKGQAIASQTQAIILLPTSERFLVRAALMDSVNDVVGALADAERAVELAPRRIETYRWVARYALNNAQAVAALDVLERADAFAPDDPDLALLRGDAHYALEDYAAAQRAYQRYLSLAQDISPVVTARLRVIERLLNG